MPGGGPDIFEDGLLHGRRKNEVSNSPTSRPRRSGPVLDPTRSPWQAEPSRYARFKSSDKLPASANVCIIGTGLSGVSIAYHLLRNDPEITVTLIEARTVCSGASGRNGGHLTCDLFSFAPALLDAGFTKEEVAHHAQFEIENFDAVTELIEKEDIACEYKRKLHYDVCTTPQEFQTALRGVEAMRDCNGPLSSVKVWGNPEASKLCGVQCHGLIEHNYSASINPYKLVTEMLDRLMRRYPARIALYTETPVLQITGPSTIVTPRGSLTAKHLIFATNGYASSLLPSLRHAIVPVRGQVTSCRIADDFENCSFGLGGEYLSQRPNGWVILGGGRRFARGQEVGEENDATLDPDVSRFLRDFVSGLQDSCGEARRLRDSEERWEWTGVMGFTKLGVPLVMSLPLHDDTHMHSKSFFSSSSDNGKRYICAGFTGHGMPRIFLSARYLASLVLNQTLDEEEVGRIRQSVPAGYTTISNMTESDLPNH